jgi:hypothetical protein
LDIFSPHKVHWGLSEGHQVYEQIAWREDGKGFGLYFTSVLNWNRLFPNTWKPLPDWRSNVQKVTKHKLNWYIQRTINSFVFLQHRMQWRLDKKDIQDETGELQRVKCRSQKSVWILTSGLWATIAPAPNLLFPVLKGLFPNRHSICLIIAL